MIRIELDTAKLEQLRGISKADIEALDAAVEHVESIERFKNGEELERALSEHLKENDAKTLSQIVIGFTSFADNPELDISEVVDALAKNAEEEGIQKDDLENLKERLIYIKRLCKVPGLSLIGKSRLIKENWGNSARSVKIYTESRPIFDEERNTIEGLAIQSVLNINFFDPSGTDGAIELTLTRRQLNALNRECERALKKLDAFEEYARKSGLDWVLTYGK